MKLHRLQIWMHQRIARARCAIRFKTFTLAIARNDYIASVTRLFLDAEIKCIKYSVCGRLRLYMRNNGLSGVQFPTEVTICGRGP